MCPWRPSLICSQRRNLIGRGTIRTNSINNQHHSPQSFRQSAISSMRTERQSLYKKAWGALPLQPLASRGPSESHHNQNNRSKPRSHPVLPFSRRSKSRKSLLLAPKLRAVSQDSNNLSKISINSTSQESRRLCRESPSTMASIRFQEFTMRRASLPSKLLLRCRPMISWTSQLPVESWA